MTHTPTPWFWTDCGLEGPDEHDILWTSTEGDIWARKPEDANLIVTAVNHHTELVRCVASFVDVVKAAIDAGDWIVDGACDPDADVVRACTLLEKTNAD